MNQVFNTTRAWLMFRKYFGENKKAYALLFLACGASLILLMGVNLSFTNPNLFSEPVQVSYFFIGLILWGCLSASLLFSDLGSKSKAINYLLVPASSLEKLLCTLFFGVLIFFIGYTFMFYAVDVTVVSLANAKFGTHWSVINVLAINRYENIWFEGHTDYLYYIYFGFQSFFLLGSLYFPKYGFFKTAISLVLVYVFLIFLVMIIMKNFFPSGQFYDGMTFFEVFDSTGKDKIIRLPFGFTGVLAFFFEYALVVGLWVITYFRLKEKQV
jgi:hypothetical protein